MVEYRDIVARVEPTGFVVRGAVRRADGTTIVLVGNIGGTIWSAFRAGQSEADHPLDDWTRSVLSPIADEFGARYVHPSDEPYQPFQRWAEAAGGVWRSPIGLLIDAQYGLWHAYRGAFVFDAEVSGVPEPTGAVSPCSTCDDQPCLSTCPVDAFSAAGFDDAACREHLIASTEPDCLTDGCVARRACPVAAERRYGPDQMGFHMRALLGAPTESS